jgi:cysteine-S-conjugate beta-lyase
MPVIIYSYIGICQASTVDLSVPDLATLKQRRSEKWALHAADVLPSFVAEMDFPVAPPIVTALRAALDRHDLGYATPAPASLRRGLADFAGRRLRWEIDPEQVTLVPDVMAGLLELCRVLLSPGEAVAFATPAYPPFFAELPTAADRIEEIPLRADRGFDLELLGETIAGGVRALVLVNPHNPTGRVLPREELAAIADLCAGAGVWVLADEIHAPLTLAGAEHVPFLEVSESARRCGIALTSASKAFNVAGLKAAFAVTASGRARDAVALLPDLSERAGLLGLVAAEAAFAEGDEWLDAVLQQLDRNRAELAGLLSPTRIAWTPPQASYLAWLDCRALGLGDEPAEAFLERGRVALARGLDYGSAGAGFVRLNFGTSPELLAETVRRMTASLG